jgi:hypothetical protein
LSVAKFLRATIAFQNQEITIELCHLPEAQREAFLPGGAWAHLPAVLW